MKPRYIKFYDQNIFFQKKEAWNVTCIYAFLFKASFTALKCISTIWSITHLRGSEGSTDGRLLFKKPGKHLIGALSAYQNICDASASNRLGLFILQCQRLNVLMKILMLVHFDSHIAQGRTIIYRVIDILSHAYSYCHQFDQYKPTWLTFHICSKWSNTMCCFIMKCITKSIFAFL